jgi:ribonuclease VapC
MVIDSSALASILLHESGYARFRDALAAAPYTVISAATWLEAAMVVTSRLGAQGRSNLDLLLATTGTEIIAVNAAMAEVAYDGWLRFGKGRHPAGLNFGDCFSYALAKLRAEPLLFKGDDFSKTDIVPAV